MKVDFQKCFIPKKSTIQPAFYRNLGTGREAVFFDENNNEFIIRLDGPWYGEQYWDRVEVLRQMPTHRSEILVCKTVKAAIERLMSILQPATD